MDRSVVSSKLLGRCTRCRQQPLQRRRTGSSEPWSSPGSGWAMYGESVQAHVDPTGRPGRGEHVAVIDEQYVGVDKHLRVGLGKELRT